MNTTTTYSPKHDDAAQAFDQSAHFFKNLSIIGGLLVLAAAGPGRYSVDQT